MTKIILAYPNEQETNNNIQIYETNGNFNWNEEYLNGQHGLVIQQMSTLLTLSILILMHQLLEDFACLLVHMVV